MNFEVREIEGSVILVSEVRDLIKEAKAMARGEDLLAKQSSNKGSSLNSLSPAQLNTLADRIEKAGHVQEASEKIVEMRKDAHASSQLTDVELKKLAYKQALRELGFKEAKLSPINVMFGNMEDMQNLMCKAGADIVSGFIADALNIGLSDNEEASE